MVPSRQLTAAFDAHDPVQLARFWAGVLNRDVIDVGGGHLLPGSDAQLSLRFVRSHAERRCLNRMHLHLTSGSLADQEHTVEVALSLGAAHLDVGQRPEEGHIVLADPEGNAFCVIEPDNAFLAGCGFLGELACEGTRQVGTFWSAAMGWPLVWDQDEETAIQSPQGGTKIAWGGPPVAPDDADRQRLELNASDVELAAEVDRLVSLGARLVTAGEGGAELLDPDGKTFALTT